MVIGACERASQHQEALSLFASMPKTSELEHKHHHIDGNLSVVSRPFIIFFTLCVYDVSVLIVVYPLWMIWGVPSFLGDTRTSIHVWANGLETC